MDTSALDNYNEQIVLKTLKNYQQIKLVFIRMIERLNFCDHIYKINNCKATLLK